MKAIHISSYLPSSAPYTSLTPSTVPDPIPSPNHLLIHITHTSLNHVDLLYSRGLHQNNHSRLITPPFTLGLEFSGIILSSPTNSTSSTNITSFHPGDHIWGSSLGSHAEFISVSPSSIRHLPPNCSLEDAAGIGAATAPVSYGALVLCAGIKTGEVVLVHAAAGGLGVAAVQIAFALGCRVIGTVGSGVKAEALKSQLGEQLVGVVRYDEEGWEKEVVKMSGGEGVDVVYDTVGLVLGSIRCCRFGGRVVIAGFAGREGKMETLAMNRVLLKGVKLFGYRFGESGRRDPEHTRKCWEGVDNLLTEGKLKPVIYKKWKGLENVGLGMQELWERKIYGKAIVEVQAVDIEDKAKL